MNVLYVIRSTMHGKLTRRLIFIISRRSNFRRDVPSSPRTKIPSRLCCLGTVLWLASMTPHFRSPSRYEMLSCSVRALFKPAPRF